MSSLAHLAPLRAEVSLGALRHNARRILALAGGAEVMAAVKANAYGHGAVPVAHALVEAGVTRLAVANALEGVALREAGVAVPVLVMGAALPEALPLFARHALAVTVTSAEGAGAVAEAARRDGPLTVHVKVDTGMHRLGVEPDEAPAVLRLLGGTENVTVEGLWTHFANVDGGFTTEQVDRFDALLATLEGEGVPVPPLVHLANTGGLLATPASVRGRQVVRAGGALYGLVSDRMLAGVAADLRPVMRLVSRVVQVKAVGPGETVSYGRTWRATEPTLIATVAAGYGDGVPRSLSNRGRVGVGGRLYPVAGRVCMDMLMLDLGRPDGPGASVRTGDEAVLFGPGGPSALDVADAAGTIAYVLTTGLTARVPRCTADG
ncbi:MAG TPA: alanine racemase [Rubricoccaceae bacterium]